MTSSSRLEEQRLEASGADVVQLDVPASAGYISVVRSASTGLAARVDLGLDRIEDLRVAVDETCTMLVRGGADDPDPGTLLCVFLVHETSFTAEISGPHVELPAASAIAWSVLSALVDQIESGDEQDRTWVRLLVRRGIEPWN